MSKALEGIRVLDLSQFEAGPSCTEFLGFLGADIIKIEPPGKGDQGRKSNRDKFTREKDWDSWFFVFLNANKRSVTMNLKSPEAVDMLKAMVKKCDVIISNYTPGTMEKFGVGYDVLSKINPGIVYVECSGFGKGGPYSKYPAFDQVAKAAGGILSDTGEPGGPPCNPGPNVGDTGSGIHMAAAILAALLQRTRTGEGQAIDMGLTDNAINLNRSPIANTQIDQQPIIRSGCRNPRSPPNDIYPCKGGGPDDYIFIFGVNHYERLMKFIGRPDLCTPDLVDWLDNRNARLDELHQAIAEWTIQRDKMTAFHELARAGVPCGPVLNTVEVMNDPHFIQRGMIVEIEHPHRGKIKIPGCPVKMSKSDATYTPAPLLGQHNEEIYQEFFGYSKEEVAELKEKNVI